ncbi:MAG: VapC toxin family PIN domain ribonuclease, partial [Candidatus Promineifilaceae bacterium]
ARLSRIGRSPAFIDGQIASVAAANNLILVTRNVHDFINFQGITIENWFESKQQQ